MLVFKRLWDFFGYLFSRLRGKTSRQQVSVGGSGESEATILAEGVSTITKLASVFETRALFEGRDGKIANSEEIFPLDVDDMGGWVGSVLYCLEYKIGSSSQSFYLVENDLLWFESDFFGRKSDFNIWFSRVSGFDVERPRFDVFVRSEKGNFCRKSVRSVSLGAWFAVEVESDFKLLARLKLIALK